MESFEIRAAEFERSYLLNENKLNLCFIQKFSKILKSDAKEKPRK